jgi:hypothetical protein
MHLLKRGYGDVLQECMEVVDYLGGKMPETSELLKDTDEPACAAF